MSSLSRYGNAGELLRFEWSVRALAQEASVQFTLFPSFVCVADELALEFDECLRRLSTADGVVEFDPEQVKLVEDLDQRLAAMSGPEHEELWTDEALKTAPEWNEIRAAARLLVDKMGWVRTPPPSDRSLYIGPDA